MAPVSDSECEGDPTVDHENCSYLIGEDELEAHTIELIQGDKSTSKWLIVDNTYIFHKNTSSVDGSETFWECSDRRKHECPVRAGTVELEDGELDLLYLYHPDFHTCDQDGIDVIKQRFKNKVKTILKNDHRKKYAEVRSLKGVWN